MLAQAQALAGELVRLRRDLHQHPELSFQEFRTAQLVAEMLADLGFTVQTGVGRTGVVGELGDGDGPLIAIRADMDALPIQEQSDVPYRSHNEGVMHACGHDAHTAMALGAAQLLKECFAQERWRGKVRFLFQPAEELFDEHGVSGGTAMIQDGALEGVAAVFAVHIWSTAPAGVCQFQDGYSMASGDVFEARVCGSGGHGAFPHKGTDPLFMLAPILTSLFAIPSRRIDPLRACVVSLGQIHSGTAPNVIPGEVYLQGNLRAFEPDVREQLWAEVENAVRLSEGMGGGYELKIHKGYPALFNDPKVNDWLRTTVRDLVGQEAAVDLPFGMACEDFAYMAQCAPGAMFLLGAARNDGVVRGHHTAIFDIDERVLPIGAAVLAETARRFVCAELSK